MSPKIILFIILIFLYSSPDWLKLLLSKAHCKSNNRGKSRAYKNRGKKNLTHDERRKHWVFKRWLRRLWMDEAPLDEQRRMRKQRVETVGGLLVSMEVNNENHMTWGLQESISFFSSFSLPPFLSSHRPSFLPAEPTPFSTFKIPPAFFSPVSELIFTRFAQQKIFISKLPME